MAEGTAWAKWRGDGGETTWVRVTSGVSDGNTLTLGAAAARARAALGKHGLVAWWCDPTIDLALVEPPATFGRQWPEGEELQVDEVAFYADRAVWRAARTVAGPRWVFIEDVAESEPDAVPARVVYTPAHLHGSDRFAAASTGKGSVRLREWYALEETHGFRRDEIIGFTLVQEER